MSISKDIVVGLREGGKNSSSLAQNNESADKKQNQLPGLCLHIKQRMV